MPLVGPVQTANPNQVPIYPIVPPPPPLTVLQILRAELANEDDEGSRSITPFFPPPPPTPVPPIPPLTCVIALIDDFNRTAGPMDWGIASGGLTWGLVNEAPFPPFPAGGSIIVNVLPSFGHIDPTINAVVPAGPGPGGRKAATVPLPFNPNPDEFIISGTTHLTPNFPVENNGVFAQSAILDYRIVIGDGNWIWSNQSGDGSFSVILDIDLNKSKNAGDPDPAGGIITVNVTDSGTTTVFTAPNILAVASIDWSIDRSVSRGTIIYRLNTGPGGLFDNFEYETPITVQAPSGPLQLWIQGYANAHNIPANYTPFTTTTNLQGCSG